MILRHLTVGPLDVNCYMIADEVTKDAVCIDPGGDVDDILEVIKNDDLKLKYIINTHGHFDHIGGNEALKKTTGAKLAIHKNDASLLAEAVSHAAFFGVKSINSPEPDMLLNDGDVIKVGKIEAKIIHTPGHTKGGVCLLISECEKSPHPPFTKGGYRGINSQILFTGDTLFAGSVGRTDLPGGSFEELLFSIKNKLMVFADDVKVYPGHGPSTTIGEERENNTYF